MAQIGSSSALVIVLCRFLTYLIRGCAYGAELRLGIFLAVGLHGRVMINNIVVHTNMSHCNVTELCISPEMESHKF